jgi:D-alanyl-D-alanine carboxypeptidase-like protein
MGIINRVLPGIIASTFVFLGASVSSPPQAGARAVGELPPFTSTVRPVTAERLGESWRPDCPVGPDQLRLLTLRIVGFDGRAHHGELIVATAVVDDVVDTFAELYRDRFPIERMITIEKYDADDDRSMAANNTSAFNCRPVTGGTEWSNHSYGRAIDVNPMLNPYVTRNGTVLPPNGAPYVDRTRTDPGLIHAGDSTVHVFERHGWEWGGYWHNPIDYQHFEKPEH